MDVKWPGTFFSHTELNTPPTPSGMNITRATVDLLQCADSRYDHFADTSVVGHVYADIDLPSAPMPRKE